jgi:hypothetical protein
MGPPADLHSQQNQPPPRMAHLDRHSTQGEGSRVLVLTIRDLHRKAAPPAGLDAADGDGCIAPQLQAVA